MEFNPCRHVLLIEDDEDLRCQMAAILEDENYRVVTAENGKVALDYLLDCDPLEYPGCIILDLMMPVMTGGQFLKKVVNEYPQNLAKIPVIVATAKGSPTDEIAGLPIHVGRIKKPMDIQDLVDVVVKHCGIPLASL
jgi:DNA-binding response OmpR family regulator